MAREISAGDRPRDDSDSGEPSGERPRGGLETWDDPSLIGVVTGASPEPGRNGSRIPTGGRALAELSRWHVSELRRELALRPGQALRLAAAFELARRTWEGSGHRAPSLTTPRRVYEFVRPRLLGRQREVFLSLLLDSKHRLRRCVQISEGTLTSSLVHPREVFRSAVLEGAAALVCVHNHPSGDPEPSAEDLATTQRLASVGRILGVPLVDHVVVGSGSYCSIREKFGACWKDSPRDVERVDWVVP